MPRFRLTRHDRQLRRFLLVVFAGLTAVLLTESDHADPAAPLRLSTTDDRGLTGLFAFPTKGGKRVDDAKDADSLVLILCANRSLTRSPPYQGLDTFWYTIHLDMQREVRINYPKDNAIPTRPEE